MTDKPAILQVIPHLGVGGAELSTVEIVDALSAIGVRTLVATQGGRMVADVERLGGEVILMKAATKNPVQIMRNKGLLEQLIDEHNILLVHARSRAPAWTSLLAARNKKIPFVTTYHGAYGELGPFKRLYNSVMSRGDKVIANSQFTGELVRERYQIEEDRLRIIYRGAEISRFSKSAVTADRSSKLRASWGAPEGCRIVFHPARMTRLKGHGVVIEGLKKFLERGGDQNIMVIFAGDYQGRDAYMDELRHKVMDLGVEKHVKFVGHCADMPAAYGLAHVSIIASTEPETFGRTSAEAQAMGCPVIATNIGAPPETVRAEPFVSKNETTGWLVPPSDPEALAEALFAALKMGPEDHQQLAGRAIENIRHCFSDQLMKAQTLAVYDELLGTEFAARYKEASRD